MNLKYNLNRPSTRFELKGARVESGKDDEGQENKMEVAAAEMKKRYTIG